MRRSDPVDRAPEDGLGNAPGAPAAGLAHRAWTALGTIVSTVVIAALAIIVLGNGRSEPPVAASPSLAAVGPAGSESPPPSVDVRSPSPSPSPPPKPSPTEDPATPSVEPTERPTADPTPRPTEEPTPRPPRATPDPRPEPTTRIYSGSGALGDPLTVHGVTLTMARTDVPATVGDVCARVDRDTYAYSFRMAWEDPKGVNEPYVGVGAHQYSAVWFEPRFLVNTEIVVVVCHQPDDGNKVFVESSPDGTPMTLYQWRFTP